MEGGIAWFFATFTARTSMPDVLSSMRKTSRCRIKTGRLASSGRLIRYDWQRMIEY